MGFLGDLGQKHEALKKRIHSYRIPLSARGRSFMAVVYASLALVFGYGVTKVPVWIDS